MNKTIKVPANCLKVDDTLSDNRKVFSVDQSHEFGFVWIRFHDGGEIRLTHTEEVEVLS